MKRNLLIALALLGSLAAQAQTPQPLPFSQNWTNTGLITTNNVWTGVPGIVGYSSDLAGSTTGLDPQLQVSAANLGASNVLANQTSTNITNGGLAEFEIANPVVALQGSGGADAPSLVIAINTLCWQGITIQYNARDIDGGNTDNAAQQVALQYRVGSSGDFTNLPAGYIADATTGPNLATLVTPVSVTLPAACNDQPVVQLRIITTNAVGNDEWVGIDDISITGTALPTSTNISATLNGAGSFCFEGNTADGTPPLSFSITGGTGPYTVDYTDGLSTNYPAISGYASGTAIANALMFTTTYTPLSVVDANGCAAGTLSGTPTFFVSQDQPVAANSATSPPTCANNDGSITITTTSGGMGPYTYTWTTTNGSGIVQGSSSQVALGAGDYELIITDNNGCDSEPIPFSLPAATGCNNICPGFGGSSSPARVCAGGNFSVSVLNLSNMAQAANGEANFGIDFVYFAAPTGTPYTGGTLLGSVPFASLGGGGTSATLSITNTTLPAGNYFVYGILNPTPANANCRPAQNFSFEVVPGPTVFNVTGGGAVCENGGGLPIGLSGSQNGMSYTLRRDGNFVGSETGTGSALNFGNFSTPGTYTVSVFDNSPASCTAVMNGNAVISNLPESPPPTVSSPVVYCQNDVAVPLSATGTNLLWYTSLADPTGDPLAPTPLTTAVGMTSYFVTQQSSGSAPVSTLAPGDIAIIGQVDNTTPDVFAFVPLVPLAAGTVIYFTDNGWTGTQYRGAAAGDGDGNEGLTKYTAPAVVAAGTVIYSNSADFMTSGMIPGTTQNFSALAIATGGDQVYAFQNSNPSNPMFNLGTITHLFVFDDTNGFENATSASEGNVPPGLTAGVTANTFNFAAANRIQFNNDGMSRTAANWLTEIANPANYTTSAGTLSINNLNITATGSLLCESDRAEIVVDVQQPATANIPVVAPVCINTPISLSVTLGGSATANAGSWSANIPGGSFAPNNTNNSVTYTPPTNFAGNITFSYLTNDPAGPCPAVSTTRVVEVQTGGVDAGPDQTICAGTAAQLAGALSAGATTPASWTASVGGGSFSNASALNSSYTPPAAFTGNITLTLTATGNDGPCPSPFDQMVITVLPQPAAPTVVSPVLYCQNATATPLTANGTNLLWYTSPGDLTGDPTAPTPSTAMTGSTSFFVTQTIPTTPFVSTLAPGDIAIIALKDGTDDFAFAPLVNLAAGTVLYFTDNGWTGTEFRGTTATNAEGNEDIVQYIAPANILAGTVITMIDPSSPTMLSPGFTPQGTPIMGASSSAQQYRPLDFNTANGDQIYAFQNTNPNNPMFNTATVTHLFVFDDTNGFESATTASEGAVPPGLTLGSTALTFPFVANSTSQLVNDGATRTRAQWLSYIANAANYAQTPASAVAPISIANLRLPGCESPRAEIVVTVNARPNLFNVTGGGEICVGDPIGGLPVNLSGSQLGVNYQLQFNGTNVGPVFPGTGNPIAFGNQAPGVGNYTVVATVVATGCSIVMNGSAQVIAVNCSIEITDPCICKNNATNLINGQFGEEITIFAITGQTWTLISNTGLYQTSSPNPPGNPILIPTGTQFVETPAGSGDYVLNGVHIDALGYSITVRNDRGQVFQIGNTCAYPNPVLLSNLDGPFCLGSAPVALQGTPGDANPASVTFAINGIPVPGPNPVFNPGAGVGSYLIEYIVDGGVPKAAGPNDPGCVYTIRKLVQVVATPSNLVCNNLTNITLAPDLSTDCETEIEPDDILEGTYLCFDDYFVEIDRTLPLGNGPWLPAVVDIADVNKTYAVRVTHEISGVSCWGRIKLEDKTPPTISCQNFVVPCNTPSLLPAELEAAGFAAAFPVVDDCNSFSTTYTDSEVAQSCATGNTKIVTRTWTATDASNNKATCTQTITLDRPTLADVVLPPSFDDNEAAAFPCSLGAYPTPEWIQNRGFAGFPTVFGFPEGCNIDWSYTDERIDVCDGTYKIKRDWVIIDWCTNTQINHTQIIKVIDNQPPALTCPANLTVSTNPFQCCATVNLPDVVVEDLCSRMSSASAMVTAIDQYTGEPIGTFNVPAALDDFDNNNPWDKDTLAVFGVVPTCLPLGQHTVMYTVEDHCGNSRSCSYRLTVEDLVPPAIACVTITQVAIGVDSMTMIPAAAIDNGSTDNCGNLFFKARRVEFSDCQDNVFYHDSLRYCCADVGTTVMVEIRVWDVELPAGDIAPGFEEAHASSCMVSVNVVDKLKPVCVPPANVTVSCEGFDPSLWAYGTAEASDNCCLEEVLTTANYSQFDTTCNRGTIVRNFRVEDCSENFSTCSQRIVVQYEQDYFLRMPDDRVILACDGTGDYGKPTFFGNDCELLGVAFDDQIFTVVEDACYKIERTWTIINWCTYTPNQPCINVPNPNPSTLINDPSNIRAPVLSAPGTPAPWTPTITIINPGDPTPTNFGQIWNPNANCYRYKQIIKILDTQDPVFENCPASPVELCDFTDNSSALWNEEYWWDEGIQSHDLCEGPVDLKVTAFDHCSGVDVRFRYLLFLDLDFDGEMETVVSSTNPPTPGTVRYNNINTPDFQGGEVRFFESPSIPVNQRSRFTVLNSYTPDGTRTNAQLRFNSVQSPNIYTVPNLPYGRHKIKWIVEDKCGNETFCEYEFTIDDCKPPVVACENININLMVGGMAEIWAIDLFEYGEDNCTPDPLPLYNSLAVIRADQNPTNAFPADLPQSVVVSCADAGSAVPVQVWLQDMSGNADFCIAYVNVQDNIPGCENQPALATVAGTITMGTQGVEDVAVELVGTPNVNQTTQTNDAGQYSFVGIPQGANVGVTPTKDDNPLNGVSTYDLVLMSKHILGLEPLGSPYKMIAADANRSGSITTFDIVEFRKLILGIYNELPNNTSWRFVDKNYVFPQPSNPFVTLIPENILLPNLTNNMLVTDFEGIKIGDVNGTAVANSLLQADERSVGTLLFDVHLDPTHQGEGSADRTVKAGELFTVHFKGAETVKGYQFTLNFPGLELVDVLPGADMTMDNFGVLADALTTSVDGPANAFAVRFRALQDGQLSRMLGVSGRITKAEAYPSATGEGAPQRMDVAFRFQGANGAVLSGVGFELYQNQPNPFLHKTFIGFHLPEATEAVLRVFDESGRQVHFQRGDFGKGHNQFVLERHLIGTTGLLYYSVETPTDKGTRKMVQVR
jgi:hypothetical protein